eukprot:5682150-Prymnesium_polylepis.1
MLHLVEGTSLTMLQVVPAIRQRGPTPFGSMALVLRQQTCPCCCDVVAICTLEEVIGSIFADTERRKLASCRAVG